jgi:hypothetical protein
MPNPTEPLVVETTPVQLARMEGVLNLVADRVSGLITRVDRHEGEIGTLKSLTQSLKEGAKASTEKAEALALALKEAKEAVEATALSESNKAQAAARESAARAALGWSPITKLFAIAAAALVVVNIWQALTGN